MEDNATLLGERHTPPTKLGHDKCSLEEVVQSFVHNNDKKRVRVACESCNTLTVPHGHETRCVRHKREAAEKSLENAMAATVVHDMCVEVGGFECNVELWSFYIMRYKKQHAAFLQARRFVYKLHSAPEPEAKPKAKPKTKPEIKTKLEPKAKSEPKAKIEREAAAEPKTKPDPARDCGDNARARLWIFAVGAQCPDREHPVHASVLHSAAHLFDVYASVRVIRTHEVVRYAGVALMLASKACGAEGSTYSTIDVLCLTACCSGRFCNTDALRGIASRISSVGLPYVEPSDNEFMGNMMRDLGSKEIEMFFALNFQVDTRITIFHFTDILLDVMDVDDTMRALVDAAAVIHCVRNETFSTDLAVAAARCVRETLTLSNHNNVYRDRLDTYMAAVKTRLATHVDVPYVGTV